MNRFPETGRWSSILQLLTSWLLDLAALSLRVLPSKRLFVGIELPSSCKELLSGLDPLLDGLRWVPKEQLHLTLSFLGKVEASAEDRLREALGQVRVPPFFLPLRGVGVFNSRERPSVVWVGVGKGHPHLFLLHRRIQNAVLQIGLEGDLKTFHPHVTIGRAKGISRQALQPFLRSNAETEFCLARVTGFQLYSSILAKGGATHRVEMRQEFWPMPFPSSWPLATRSSYRTLRTGNGKLRIGAPPGGWSMNLSASSGVSVSMRGDTLYPRKRQSLDWSITN